MSKFDEDGLLNVDYLVIVGTGAAARQTWDCLEASGSLPGTVKLAFADDGDPNLDFVDSCGALFLGSVQSAASLAIGRVSFVPAVGSSSARADVYTRCLGLGWSPYTVIHPSAVIGEGAVIGKGSVIGPGCIVDTGAALGVATKMSLNSIIAHDAIAGDYLLTSAGSAIGGGCVIGTGVTLYMNATVIPGVSIGDHATVGAGAVVIKDVGDSSVVVGNPARAI